VAGSRSRSMLRCAILAGYVAAGPARADEANLFQNRDFPVLTDYRALLGGLFRRLYDLDAASLGRIFPDAAPHDLALL